MAAVLKKGTAITFSVTPGENGFLSEPVHSFTKAVLVDGVVTWEDTTPVLWADALANGIVFPTGASSSVDTDTKAVQYALFAIGFLNSQGDSVGQVHNSVVVESGDLLRVLENSFGTWPELAVTAAHMVSLKDFGYAPESEQKAALINAFHNIADVHVDFCPPHRRARWHSQSRMWDDTGVFESDIEKIYSTRQLTMETWAKLRPDHKEKLIRAQLVEANHLLSGQTPEKQRLSGLLSHSAGESTHFYRTTKPLELPVSRATALALKGIISYVVRISG